MIKPQIREFPFKTKVFERFSRVEESVRVAVAESYLEGVSTRKVEKVFSKFGLENISASEVSRIAKRLDKQVKEFLNRPIVGSIPYLFLDASYFKVRTDGRYINKALLVVTAIHEDGYREILSAAVDDSEDESCWENCFESLKAGGLTGVKLVISYGHKGIQAAVRKAFLGASWQISLTEVSESFDVPRLRRWQPRPSRGIVETCVTFTSCVPCSRIYQRKIKKRLLIC